jgi:(2Fe-2S) ferredoxin
MPPDRSHPQDPAPFYEAHVFCCTNDRGADAVRPSCARRGAVELRDYMKKQAKSAGLRKIRINASGCLDRCELGCTMVIYPEGVWYTYHSRADVDEIIETHLRKNERVQRLLLHPKQTMLRPGQLSDNDLSKDRPEHPLEK